MGMNIRVFGDSNTWGWDPGNTLDNIRRLPDNVRWPAVMQTELGREISHRPMAQDRRLGIPDGDQADEPGEIAHLWLDPKSFTEDGFSLKAGYAQPMDVDHQFRRVE